MGLTRGHLLVMAAGFEAIKGLADSMMILDQVDKRVKRYAEDESLPEHFRDVCVVIAETHDAFDNVSSEQIDGWLDRVRAAAEVQRREAAGQEP